MEIDSKRVGKREIFMTYVEALGSYCGMRLSALDDARKITESLIGQYEKENDIGLLIEKFVRFFNVKSQYTDSQNEGERYTSYIAQDVLQMLEELFFIGIDSCIERGYNFSRKDDEKIYLVDEEGTIKTEIIISQRMRVLTPEDETKDD